MSCLQADQSPSAQGERVFIYFLSSHPPLLSSLLSLQLFLFFFPEEKPSSKGDGFIVPEEKKTEKIS